MFDSDSSSRISAEHLLGSVANRVMAAKSILIPSIADSVPEFQLQSRLGSIDDITLRNILSHHADILGGSDEKLVIPAL